MKRVSILLLTILSVSPVTHAQGRAAAPGTVRTGDAIEQHAKWHAAITIAEAADKQVDKQLVLEAERQRILSACKAIIRQQPQTGSTQLQLDQFEADREQSIVEILNGLVGKSVNFEFVAGSVNRVQTQSRDVRGRPDLLDRLAARATGFVPSTALRELTEGDRARILAAHNSAEATKQTIYARGRSTRGGSIDQRLKAADDKLQEQINRIREEAGNRPREHTVAVIGSTDQLAGLNQDQRSQATGIIAEAELATARPRAEGSGNSDPALESLREPVLKLVVVAQTVNQVGPPLPTSRPATQPAARRGGARRGA